MNTVKIHLILAYLGEYTIQPLVREWTLFIPGERSEDNWEGVLKKYGVMERGSEKNGIL